MGTLHVVGAVALATTLGLAPLPAANAASAPVLGEAEVTAQTNPDSESIELSERANRKISGKLPNGDNFKLPPVGQAPFPTSANSPGLPGSQAASNVVEPAPPYVPQTSCDPGEKKGIKAFKALVMSTYPAGRDWGSSRNCTDDGTSEHLEGRAWDWNVDVNNPTQFTQAGQLLGWLTADGGANAKRLGIMYIGYNYRIWGAYRASEGWRALSNSNPHTDHVHFSFTWNGARKKTSFWTGKVKSNDYGPCRIYQGQPAPLRAGKNSSPCPPAAQLPNAWGSAGLLWRGSTGSLVATAQSKLGATQSGTFDASTAKAAAAFQHRAGIPATGAVDAATWFALGMGEPVSKVKRSLKKGKRGKDVKRLQRALRMNKKKRDGRYRKSTVRAVKSWKRANGLRPNGRASKSFQRSLGL